MKAFLTGAALSALIAGTAIAQDMPPPPGGPGGPPPMMHPLRRIDILPLVTRHFAALDANHDGAVTRAEIDARREAMRAEMEARRKARREAEFSMLDTDRNGVLSKQEFAAPPPPPPGEARPPLPVAGEAPPPPLPHGRGPHGPGMMRGRGPMGGLGMISARRFEQADVNHDGKVTLMEAQAAALAAFDKADANHDGTIGPDEMRGPWGRKDRGMDHPPL